MRYEHIELDISTEACSAVLFILPALIGGEVTEPEPRLSQVAKAELQNFANELRSRLQHRDADPHCSKNQVSTEKEWLDL